MLLRTGIDLIEIHRLADLQPAIRQRFLQRVFTPRELALSGEGENETWATLTGRFAAKEAVAKALGCGIGPVSWQEIEVLRGPQGEPELELHGAAFRISQELGLETWSVSISHSHDQAVAVAAAIGGVAIGGVASGSIDQKVSR
jgi:holo-[acyl-carrier protein] synthase